jgi:hypothetical protein
MHAKTGKFAGHHQTIRDHRALEHIHASKGEGKTLVEIGDAGVYVSANRKLNPMNSEQKKAIREKQVFLKFIKESRLPIDLRTVENRSPPEPDILCRHEKEGLIAFELVELCERELAWNIKKSIQAESVSAFASLNSDPCNEIILEKMRKSYQTQYPIELLCYTDGRIITPDKGIIETILDVIGIMEDVKFRRVWLLGDKAFEVWERWHS